MRRFEHSWSVPAEAWMDGWVRDEHFLDDEFNLLCERGVHGWVVP